MCKNLARFGFLLQNLLQAGHVRQHGQGVIHLVCVYLRGRWSRYMYLGPKCIFIQNPNFYILNNDLKMDGFHYQVVRNCVPGIEYIGEGGLQNPHFYVYWYLHTNKWLPSIWSGSKCELPIYLRKLGPCTCKTALFCNLVLSMSLLRGLRIFMLDSHCKGLSKSSMDADVPTLQ